MAERRIAEVVGQGGRRDDCTKIEKRKRAGKVGVSLKNDFSHPLPKRSTDTGDFEAVCETGVDKIMLREGVDLGFVL